MAPKIRKSFAYYPLLLLFLAAFYTDFTGLDITMYTVSSFVYCLPAGVLMLFSRLQLFGKGEVRLYSTVIPPSLSPTTFSAF